ncbi:MAG: class I SAM-dependent methyltransferase [Thermoplasmata archaeon]|nr:class I SAM-dependent methyltransferase [Thermoplasmata archaeon]
MPKELLYKKFAKYYDSIYSGMEYKKDVELIQWLADKYKKTDGNRLLDVACGTGSHAILLKDKYSILGIDKNIEMIELAQDKVKGAEFRIADMKNFELGEQFDVIICMFSSMGYNTSYVEFETTLRNFYKHLYPGGIFVFDTWFHKRAWIEGYMNLHTVIEDNLQLARVTQSRSKDNIGNFNMLFIVKDNGVIDFEIDQHKLLIIDVDKVKMLMEELGFETHVFMGYTRKLWEPNSKQRPYFCGVKK